ncbi:MAG: hypothetical protein D4R72_04955 [Nitrosopumilales archaeon]|nr:MAG: hypothetical protein D4R72_04955 [Nitrosopumilales archaeon]
MQIFAKFPLIEANSHYANKGHKYNLHLKLKPQTRDRDFLHDIYVVWLVKKIFRSTFKIKNFFT